MPKNKVATPKKKHTFRANAALATAILALREYQEKKDIKSIHKLVLQDSNIFHKDLNYNFNQFYLYYTGFSPNLLFENLVCTNDHHFSLAFLRHATPQSNFTFIGYT